MKLLRLKINSPFSSLDEGFEIKFRQPFEEVSEAVNWLEFHPFCLVGKNGSGKSNVLEALANIFYLLENCVNRPTEHFKHIFKSNKSSPDSFELEYYVSLDEANPQQLTRVYVEKRENENPTMTYLPLDEENKEPIPVTVVGSEFIEGSAPAKKYLPNLIVGYSSGENEILSLPFLKARLLQYDEYEEVVRQNLRFREPENNLIYVDYEMSQAVLLSTLIFQKPVVLDVLRDELGIKDIKRFRMRFNLHKISEKSILSSADEIIKKFTNCATGKFKNKEILILDFWVNDSTKEAFKKNFADIISLFRGFQVLYTLNYQHLSGSVKGEVYESKGFYTYGKMSVPEPKDKTFYFEDYYIEKQLDPDKPTKNLLLKNLSDGEQQFLHSLGICLMLGKRSALLLLDEPETHFNPSWRAKFVSILQKSLEGEDSHSELKDVLITSHSPFIVSDCFPDKVIGFRKNKKSEYKVECKSAKELNFNTFGTSVNIILDEIFDKSQTIGDYSRSFLDIPLEGDLTEESVRKIEEGIDILGDSLEKDLFLANLYEEIEEESEQE